MIYANEGGRRVSLTGGYRFLKLDYEVDTFGAKSGADVELDGPFFGLQVTF